MKKIAAAAKLVLADLSQLNKPAVASALAAVVVPLVAAVAGLNVTAAEVGGWLIIAGGLAATLQKLEAVSAPVKPPVAPPTLAAVPPLAELQKQIAANNASAAAPVEPAPPAPPAA